MSATFLFHIGYHKTATTWMQQLLFTKEHGFSQVASHREVFSHVVQPHGLDFNSMEFKRLIEERASLLERGAVPVVSSEIISGHPFQGGRENDVYAQRLFDVAPTAKILISVRSQIRILPSVYMQYLLRGGTMPYDIFFSGEDEIGYFGFNARHFEYDRLVKRYQALFGVENVMVLTQESIQTDMSLAASSVVRFSGNTLFSGLSEEARRVYAPSYPEYAAPVLRRINHVQRSTLNRTPIIALGETPMGLYKVAGYLLRREPIASIFSTYKPVTQYVKNHFGQCFNESNVRLASIIEHPIDLTGYPGITQAR